VNTSEIIERYAGSVSVRKILEQLQSENKVRLHLNGLKGSMRAMLAAVILKMHKGNQVFVLPDKETAAYFHNDLESLFAERELNYNQRNVLFFPTSYKRSFEVNTHDSSGILLRSEVLNKLHKKTSGYAVVTYPEALSEKVADNITVGQNTLYVEKGEKFTTEFFFEALTELGFENVDFVAEPGQFASRGGIIDIFSFSSDYPYRLEFFDDEIDSIRSFDPGNQLSLSIINRISIMPDVQKIEKKKNKISFTRFVPESTIFWFEDIELSVGIMEKTFEVAKSAFVENQSNDPADLNDLFIDGRKFLHEVFGYSVIEFGNQKLPDPTAIIHFDSLPQPPFNKNFELLISSLLNYTKQGYDNVLFSGNPKQAKRLNAIISDMVASSRRAARPEFETISLPLHEGFVDRENKIACFTDHQIFNRYHRFHLRESIRGKEAITLKEIYDLQPGDFVTHIDHGVGRFDGLEMVENNGKMQEAIRLVYQNGDLLYVSIHSLHRIAKYVGKEGIPPGLNKLGTNNWVRLKEKTKRKVKDIAKELIKLYAERKAAKGYTFSPDSYLQHELEASFIFEDTPDQNKATLDTKSDMEKPYPMDRLVCGDVGFGKTEVAVRAAFKAVTDSKQVAVLVPTTILALQHFKTFSKRLEDFPVTVEYINRFKTSAQQTQIKKKLAAGEIDILIGTHRLVSKDIQFNDLGLLIIDEEQKFGVSVKEKLKQIKVNVDTLTLTATPIPRTLQFSLMGARDLSVINTPPPNRVPIHTELRGFGQEIIANAINYEVSRNGQVYFVHNRVQNINDIADILQKFCPDVRIGIGHGQMEGPQLEQVMLDFIEGEFDVLLATTIIENGLDIPNANTIIINEAQNFGLSDLHQLRGRVGRSNRRAFCYLLTPPLSTLTTEARKRLKAIEDFSNLGSGFNIAMRDLDIRGAGNLLGGEQSGFISDIGFEMYHKILNEAMLELRGEGFEDLFKDQPDRPFVQDCQIETDLQIMIPTWYVSVTSERLSLYKELDNIESDEGLQKFAERLNDRFGPIPKEVEALFEIIRLRRLAKKIGFEKIILKNENMACYFTGNEDSEYYQSEAFTHILTLMSNHKAGFTMQQVKNKLKLNFRKIKTASNAVIALEPLVMKPKTGSIN
jgi:transcription-repair coupling factor (superfamily II helicase)